MIEVNKIYNDDCINILKQLPDKCIDMVLTDPPYLLHKFGGEATDRPLAKRATKMKQSILFMADGFNYEEIFKEFKRICCPLNLYIFCSNLQIATTMSYFEKDYATTLLVWHKTNAIPLANLTYHSNLEFIVCVREKGAFFNNSATIAEKSKIYSMPYPSNADRFHPSQKPVELIEGLIKMKSKENDLVLDCFSGSGTTAIACSELKRNFICIEKDKQYYEMSVKRLEEYNRQLKLF